MSTLVPTDAFGAEVLAHLDAQLHSARRLLAAVLAQGQAIRGQEVDAVLDHLAEIQTEMERRGALEQDRARLLTRAGQALGVPAHVVTLEAMGSLLAAGTAAVARERSADLRGMLAEIAREHRANRALMKQELAFLDHLMRQLGAGAQDSGAYAADGMPSAVTTPAYVPAARPTPGGSSTHALDLQA
ncbi:flagellar protein FlgN [Paraconexibacter sp.]|uniref:flagellar protein FlgN n=1 Tax=Paraconexibacter sp. TaxID=2949640 RepID=UPI0035680C7B